MSKAAKKARRNARKLSAIQGQNRKKNQLTGNMEWKKALSLSINCARSSTYPLFQSPITALFVTLVVGGIALSGKFSLPTTRVLLGIAWLIAVVSLSSQPKKQRWATQTSATIIVLILGYVFTPEQVASDVGILETDDRYVILGHGHADRAIEIGDGGTKFIYGGPEGTDFFRFAENSRLKVELINGAAKVSTAVNDENGSKIAEIIRNEWKVSPPPNTWDKNYNNSALEVKNNRGDIVLQIKVLPDRIQVQGKWMISKYKGIALIKAPNGGALIEVITPQRPYFADKIEPIFKYPSALHLGELVSSTK